jgi:hypothetical protein
MLIAEHRLVSAEQHEQRRLAALVVEVDDRAEVHGLLCRCAVDEDVQPAHVAAHTPYTAEYVDGDLQVEVIVSS